MTSHDRLGIGLIGAAAAIPLLMTAFGQQADTLGLDPRMAAWLVLLCSVANATIAAWLRVLPSPGASGSATPEDAAASKTSTLGVPQVPTPALPRTHAQKG